MGGLLTNLPTADVPGQNDHNKQVLAVMVPTNLILNLDYKYQVVSHKNMTIHYTLCTSGSVDTRRLYVL
jgi:hypothetical protein